MADEENFLDEDVTGDAQAEAGERPGLLSGALINVLKWIAIGLAAIILIATVSYVTFSLLVRGSQPQGLPEFSVDRPSAEIPLQYFNNQLSDIRGQTADNPPLSFVASVSIGYPEGSTKVQTELIAKTEQIQNAILIYLGRKTARELTTANLPVLEEEIKNLLNTRIMRQGLVHSVLFSEIQTF